MADVAVLHVLSFCGMQIQRRLDDWLEAQIKQEGEKK